MTTKIIITENAIIEAAPSKVYGIMRDYQVGHPAILPKSFFKRLILHEGGTGAGTVFTVEAEVFGQKSSLTMHVDEPQPGVVLREQSPKGDLVTTFTFEPVDNGTRTRLTLYTEQTPSAGLKGWVERFMNPRILRGVYQEELALINAYVQNRP